MIVFCHFTILFRRTPSAPAAPLAVSLLSLHGFRVQLSVPILAASQPHLPNVFDLDPADIECIPFFLFYMYLKLPPLTRQCGRRFVP